MEQDKVRAEFEEWYFDRHMVANRWDGLIYNDADQQEAWRAWRASREAVVVELPPRRPVYLSVAPGEAAAFNVALCKCRDAIHAAGIRTK